MNRRLVFALLLTSCATTAAVEDTRPDENDADARGAEREQLEQLLATNKDPEATPKILIRLADQEATQALLDERQALERKALAAEAQQRNNPTVHDAQQAEAQRLDAEATQLRQRAAEHFDTFATKYPADRSAPLALFSLAELERALHHDDRAETALDRIFSGYPKSSIAFDAHLLRADKLFESGDMNGALKEYDAASKGERQRAYATYKRAWCQLNLEHYELALEDFQASMKDSQTKLANEAAKDWVRTWALLKGSTAQGAKDRLEKFPHPGTAQALMKRLAATYKELGRDTDAADAERLAQ